MCVLVKEIERDREKLRECVRWSSCVEDVKKGRYCAYLHGQAEAFLFLVLDSLLYHAISLSYKSLVK
ncbi:hypothetical protein L2E82_28486 [Cichorium intybus]|uniref:Uncharacterized protein n=1 Tax=Cichorium intybus TaxID=13427 RepID=A0ACB9CVX4_CICIN|nr:hypothetical protein L2E82_28486 [Cichorium intybus]